MTRFAVLRLENTHTLVVKEPRSPVVILLVLANELTPDQLRHLCVAAPYEPVMVTADVSDASWDGKGFRAELVDVEIAPKAPRTIQSRRARDGLVKRRRGGAVMECFD